MKRPVLLAVAGAAIVAAVVLLVTSPSAEPTSFSRSGVTVRLDRASTGTVSVQVDVPTRVRAVSLFATMPRMGHMTPEIDATQEEPGLFLATGALFSMSGVWELTVRADGTTVTFEVIVT